MAFRETATLGSLASTSATRSQFTVSLMFPPQLHTYTPILASSSGEVDEFAWPKRVNRLSVAFQA